MLLERLVQSALDGVTEDGASRTDVDDHGQTRRIYFGSTVLQTLGFQNAARAPFLKEGLSMYP